MGQRAGQVLDPKRFSEVRWLGPGKDGESDWAELDGVIYAWSESNVRYESAWWLNSDGTVAKDPAIGRQRIIDAIAAQRPFNPLWLCA